MGGWLGCMEAEGRGYFFLACGHVVTNVSPFSKRLGADRSSKLLTHAVLEMCQMPNQFLTDPAFVSYSL